MPDCYDDMYIVKICKRLLYGIHHYDSHLHKYFVLDKSKSGFPTMSPEYQAIYIVYMEDWFEDWENPTRTELSLFELNFGFSIEII